MNQDLRITNRVIMQIEVKVLTGIHIGGNKEIYGIGGIDNPVIKNPLNNQPIIPGSSLKGKIKSLLSLGGENVDKIFGSDKEALTRGIFRDLVLSKESAEFLESKLGFGTYTEAKTENTIDPKTGKAVNPRITERVPAGVKFTGEIIINAYNSENIQLMIQQLKRGFQLLEMNYLGGSGTRGYGKVVVHMVEERVL